MPEIPLVPLIDGWETVEEMENALGIPAGNLATSLENYNHYAAQGEDPEFHKQPEFLAAQDKAPCGAFDLSLCKAAYAAPFTLGGLRTSVKAEVLRSDATSTTSRSWSTVRGSLGHTLRIGRVGPGGEYANTMPPAFVNWGRYCAIMASFMMKPRGSTSARIGNRVTRSIRSAPRFRSSRYGSALGPHPGRRQPRT